MHGKNNNNKSGYVRTLNNLQNNVILADVKLLEVDRLKRAPWAWYFFGPVLRAQSRRCWESHHA